MNDETAPDAAASDGQMGDGAPVLDERAFIKAAKRRSTRRIVLISGALIAAVVVMLLVGVVGWQRALYAQADRVRAFTRRSCRSRARTPSSWCRRPFARSSRAS